MPPSPDTTYLWQTLRHYIEQACFMFGTPGAIAKLIWLSRTQAKALSAWLRPLEALLRRLIFLDAITLSVTPTPQKETKARAKRGMPASFGAGFDPDNSEAWRANFQLNTSMDRRHVIPGRSEAANPELRRPALFQTSATAPLINATSAAPAALRLEALIRAYNNREALAEALARKLARNAQRHIVVMLAAPRKALAARPGWSSVIDAINLCRQAIAGALPTACADTS